MPQPPIKIEQETQLLVEGRDTDVFINALLQHLSLIGVQVHNFGGVEQLSRFLKTFIASPGFHQIVKSLGIIRDAEKSTGSARQSVHDILRQVNLPLPDQKGTPQTSVYIFPDNKNSGMLETLCLTSVQNDPAIICIERYMECLEKQQLHISNPEKAKVQAFLASRLKFVAHLGEAANKGYWQWENTAFAELKQFLKRLLGQ